jgi:hypothetical protein
LNKRLVGSLRVEIVPDADRSPLVNFLLGCRLEGVGEKRLAWIEEAEVISPLSFVLSIKKGAACFQLDWGVTQMVADALTKLQPSQIMELGALELKHRVDIFLTLHMTKQSQFSVRSTSYRQVSNARPSYSCCCWTTLIHY